MKLIHAELIKLASLLSAWIAAGLATILPAAVAVLNSRSQVSRGIDAGFQDLAPGVIGAIVIGVVAVSSEYLVEGAESGGGRQITTSLTAVASRSRFLLAKAAAVAVTVALLALLSSAITLTTTSLTDETVSVGTADLPRVAGVTAYWILTALLASGITLVTRSGIVPLTFCIVNMSVVSVSFLLTKLTSWANYLPDLAGMHLFLRDVHGSVDIAPLTGGLVMGLWVVVVAGIGFIVFRRRDA
ncbi:ABC transporter permease [Kribbella sindirgiensis]|uniref:ABC transporter permease n=1 Tax=Kribbella sindirgiensis TaxID=1124744 RepID=A0A4R0IVD4_9ACTN|nr:ABC transporter permease [Kribbella sindirgiensis]TCC37259.1 ABC transporter permease [Kribbella sindirgiensis]